MIDRDLCTEVLTAALSSGGEYADIFAEETDTTTITLKESKIHGLAGGTSHGVGVRVIYGRNSVYAYGNDSTKAGLTKLAKAVAAAVAYDKKSSVQDLTAPPSGRGIITPRVLPDGVEVRKKVEKLLAADAVARDASELVNQVQVHYIDSRQRVFVATSEGRCAEDERVRTRFVVQTVASRGEQKESGFFGPGRALGFEFFEQFSAEDIARESARIALAMLEADYAPSGKLPVVINNGFGGVILHEAVGHALEATSVADDASVFCGKLGEQVANDCVTAVDDGTVPNGWGSLNYDDEGFPTQRNVLIDKGVLASYLVDKLGSLKMNTPVTGSARRQSYAYAPTSRMTNTFIVPGAHTTDDLISSIDHGIFCKNLGGGSVNPATTDFNFAVTEAYLIEKGKLGRPLKGATLIGKGSEIIQQIDMVAGDLEHGTGMCGSLSGNIPASVGQPPVRVSGLVVGGKNQ